MASKENMSLIVECVGTFVFLSVIINTTNVNKGDPTNFIAIAVALLAVIYMGGRVSGGHFNPAVTFLFFLTDPAFKVNNLALKYVAAQLAGAYGASVFNKLVTKV